MQKITNLGASDIGGAVQNIAVNAVSFFAKKQEAITPPTQNQKQKQEAITPPTQNQKQEHKQLNQGIHSTTHSYLDSISKVDVKEEKVDSSSPATIHHSTPASTDREQVNRDLIATAQQAIEVGRKYGWLCDLEFQPLLERLTPGQRAQLEPEEMQTLSRSRHARNRLIELNLRLVKRIAANTIRKASRKVDLQDLIQDGTFGLVRATEKFDLSKNVKFATYAYKWICLYCQKGATREERIISLPKEARSLIAKYKTNSLDPDSRTYFKDVAKAKAWEIVYPHPLPFSQMNRGSSEDSICENFEASIVDIASQDWSVEQSKQNLAAVATIVDLLQHLTMEQRLVIEIKYGLGKQPPLELTHQIMKRLKELDPPPIDHKLISRASINKWEAEAMETLRSAKSKILPEWY